MAKLSHEAIRRHEDAKRNQNPPTCTSGVLGPKCRGGPPTPNGHSGGGGSFPIYGPVVKNVSTPPGPSAVTPS